MGLARLGRHKGRIHPPQGTEVIETANGVACVYERVPTQKRASTARTGKGTRPYVTVAE
jgi:hypothetical protein